MTDHQGAGPVLRMSTRECEQISESYGCDPSRGEDDWLVCRLLREIELLRIQVARGPAPGGGSPPQEETKVNELHEKIDRLLHDAEHADSGAKMAAIMRDYGASREYEAKAARLRAEALALDPEKTAPAWNEPDVPWPAI